MCFLQKLMQKPQKYENVSGTQHYRIIISSNTKSESDRLKCSDLHERIRKSRRKQGG